MFFSMTADASKQSSEPEEAMEIEEITPRISNGVKPEEKANSHSPEEKANGANGAEGQNNARSPRNPDFLHFVSKCRPHLK